VTQNLLSQTERKKEVYRLRLLGWQHKAIADKLGVHENTIINDFREIKEELKRNPPDYTLIQQQVIDGLMEIIRRANEDLDNESVRINVKPQLYGVIANAWRGIREIIPPAPPAAPQKIEISFLNPNAPLCTKCGKKHDGICTTISNTVQST